MQHGGGAGSRVGWGVEARGSRGLAKVRGVLAKVRGVLAKVREDRTMSLDTPSPACWPKFAGE